MVERCFVVSEGQLQVLRQIAKRLSSGEPMSDIEVRAAVLQLSGIVSECCMGVALDSARPKAEGPEAVLPVGHWLPTAAILCAACVGGRPAGASDTDGRHVEWRTNEWYGATRCNKCDAWIAVRDDVADLNNLRLALGAGEMQQTGGMCSALEFGFSERPREPAVMVTANDGDGFLVCRYQPSDAPEEFDWENPECLVESATLEQAIDALRAALPWLKAQE